MRITIQYAITDGEMESAKDGVHTFYKEVEDGDIYSVGTWITDRLCLRFQSMKDISNAIEILQDLRSETLKHIEKEGVNFTPNKNAYKDHTEIVSIAIQNMADSRMETTIIPYKANGRDDFSVLRLHSTEDKYLNRVDVYFENGPDELKKFGEDIKEQTD